MLIGCKKNVRFTIVVHVTDRHTSAVVKIAIAKNIHVRAVAHKIREIDPCF